MGYIVYYLFIKPLSLVPLRVSYLLSDLVFLVLYYLLRYRRKVVFANLRNAFPEKSTEGNRGYCPQVLPAHVRHVPGVCPHFQHFKGELVRRCRIRNPELVEQFYRQGKSIIIAAGHYSNWELAAVVFDAQASHQAVGIYKPLGNAFLDQKLRQSRAQFGLELVPKAETKAFFAENTHRLTAPPAYHRPVALQQHQRILDPVSQPGHRRALRHGEIRPGIQLPGCLRACPQDAPGLLRNGIRSRGYQPGNCPARRHHREAYPHPRRRHPARPQYWLWTPKGGSGSARRIPRQPIIL
ncbi:MAG: hypothetical protein H6559_34375 [Lewinellaceae bacterium]|nr:hypothetical protein [Lewinellaceae bacterium]